MSIVFCDSSQYINRNKSNCGGREAAVRWFEVCKTSIQLAQTQTSHTPLKSFAAPQLLRRLAATSFFYFLCYKK